MSAAPEFIAHDVDSIYWTTGTTMPATATSDLIAFMRDIRRGHEHVVDVLEGLYLALDDDFRELVNQAIGDLRTKRAGGDWRTALAALPD